MRFAVVVVVGGITLTGRIKSGITCGDYAMNAKVKIERNPDYYASDKVKRPIKPCPFCGAGAHKPRPSTDNKWFIDHYMLCWIGRGMTQVFDPKEIQFWNRRHLQK